MSAAPDPIVQSAERLCETLERIGDALVAFDAQTLLDTEETLVRLLTALAIPNTIDDRAALETLVWRARAALARCERLGRSFSGVARARLQLCTGVDTYRRDGGCHEAVSGTAIEARV